MDGTRLYQRGRVTELDAHTVYINFEPIGGCTACAGGCGLASIAALISTGRCSALSVGVVGQPELTIGDLVRVGIDARRLLRLVVATYLFPLFGLVAGAVAVTTLMPATGDVGALSGAVAGGLLTGGLLILSTGRRRSLAWLGARVTKLS